MATWRAFAIGIGTRLFGVLLILLGDGHSTLVAKTVVGVGVVVGHRRPAVEAQLPVGAQLQHLVVERQEPPVAPLDGSTGEKGYRTFRSSAR